MTDKELLAKAINFHIWGIETTHAFDVNVVNRGSDQWAVTFGNTYCYCKKEKGFVYEPSPSEREKDFLRNTRFTLERAVEIAEKIAAIFQSQYESHRQANYETRGFFSPNLPKKKL